MSVNNEVRGVAFLCSRVQFFLCEIPPIFTVSPSLLPESLAKFATANIRRADYLSSSGETNAQIAGPYSASRATLNPSRQTYRLEVKSSTSPRTTRKKKKKTTSHTGDFYDGCDSDRRDLAHNFCAPDVCVWGFGVDGFLSAGHGTTGIFLPLGRTLVTLVSSSMSG